MSMALNKDTLLNSVLAASGGKQVIKYNKNGDPLVMVRIPRFNMEDIHPDLGAGPHPAFIVNGIVKNEIYIGAYQAIIEKSCAISIPGQSPKVSLNYDAAKAACVANGPGFHLMTAWEWAAIAFWCLKNGFQPRGNTASGKAHDATYETGTPAPDNAAKTLGGSGPVSWRHDNTIAGIADLVGNVWEWNDGLKMIDGRLYFPIDNHFDQPDTAWPASSIYLDASAGPNANGTIIVSNSVSKNSMDPDTAETDDNYSASNTWTSTGVSTGFDGLAQPVRQQAAQLLIAPKLTSGGAALFPAARGAFYSRNYGERRPIRGGGWDNGAGAGLATLYLSNRRSGVASGIGLRPAFIL
jgi:hypothetical protein